MGKVFIIDLERCTGCMSCVIACKDEFVANDWSPYSKPQPDYGHFWMRVDALERGTTPKVKVTYTPVPCMHCDNAPCIRACPANAIVKRNDGIVWINPNKCDGCKELENKFLCLKACPYNAIYVNNELGIAQKCTMCIHLLEDPNWKYGPRCYSACPTEAIIYGDENDPKVKELIGRAELLHPQYNSKPRVYYLNMPRPFIGGCVVDPAEKEVIIDATVTAIDLQTGDQHETRTDDFGDFWLKNLIWNHRYLVKVEKEGYGKKIIGVYTTEKDVNIGVINLSKKS
jgi:Fe-S-cluster-containing dehydrogenase component